MPVTELALLRLKPGTTLQTPSLHANLAKAQKTMEAFSNYRFQYLQQIEDPSLIYVLGEWASLSQHYDEFIPSAPNQELLALMQDQVDVVWLMHLDVGVAEIPLNAPCLSIGRHIIEDGMREGFTKAFGENRDALDGHVTEGRAVGGWKVDQGVWNVEEDKMEGKKDQFVLFAPWRNVEQHMRFAETEAFARYGRIREWVSGFNVKHVRVLKVET